MKFRFFKKGEKVDVRDFVYEVENKESRGGECDCPSCKLYYDMNKAMKDLFAPIAAKRLVGQYKETQKDGRDIVWLGSLAAFNLGYGIGMKSPINIGASVGLGIATVRSGISYIYNRKKLFQACKFFYEVYQDEEDENEHDEAEASEEGEGVAKDSGVVATVRLVFEIEKEMQEGGAANVRLVDENESEKSEDEDERC